MPSTCSTGRPAAVVVDGDVELGPVEEGIPREFSEGGSPGAGVAELEFSISSSGSGVVEVAVGFCLVEVLCSPAGPVVVGPREGGAPAAFEAVPGASADSAGRCDSLSSR